MSKDQILNPGVYLGVRSSVRSFMFKLPKKQNKSTESYSPIELFNRLNNGTKITKSETFINFDENYGEQTTRFSGWKHIDGNAAIVSDKMKEAPVIYRAAGGSDFEQAAELVKTFKKTAARVLGHCADTGEPLTADHAAEINKTACIVHEVRVILLCVSDARVNKSSRFDEKTKKWYTEKCGRKFYLEKAPATELLDAFAEALADPESTISGEGRLIVERKTDESSGGTRKSSFRIVSCNSYGERDEGLMKVLTKLANRYSTITSKADTSEPDG